MKRLLLPIALFCAPAAFAGECPADQLRPNAQVDATEMSNAVTTGVIETPLAMTDLTEQYQMPGRTLRTRRLEINPGGVVAVHEHLRRPAVTFVLNGRITEYRSDCATPIEHSAGDVVTEAGTYRHYWRNNASRRVVLITTDILPPPEPEATVAPPAPPPRRAPRRR